MSHPAVDGPPVAGTDEEKPRDKSEEARAWLARISQAEKDFGGYQDRADNVDKLYSSLDRLAETARDRQFQMFWANVQVLGPSIYSRPPVPVVVPRFKDRRPLYRTASELLERAVTVAFEHADIDAVMRLTRDDLTVLARGVPWCRFEKKSDGEPERVCVEHVHRRDFLHEPARNWSEVGWVARRSWLTRRALRKRFRERSGSLYKDAALTKHKDETEDYASTDRKAGVWEVWSKTDSRVYWVAEGCDGFLDDDDPHLTLEGFFPCPRPAYSTVQRGTLIPVPDMVFYKDQLEEINELTARISALSEAVKVRAFYPAGAGEIADAIEAAVRSTTDNAIMIPVSNWNMIGTGNVKDMLVWLPIEMIVAAIRELVEMRRQLIEDVYQITGLSDIMRGSTEASETLGAQQLKSQYGSIRIRDRQEELVRVARDLTRISAEIMAESFTAKALLEMSQMEVPSDADIKRQVADIVAQVKRAERDPQMQKMARADPGQAKAMLDQANAEIERLEGIPTIEQVMKLLKDQRLRPFALDIETDSTIAPDENAQKQRATEYVTAMGALISQAMPVLAQFPQAAPLIGDTIRFAQSQFRVGRQMDQTVEEFVDAMKQMASRPPPDPNAGAAEAERVRVEGEMQLKQADMQMRQQEAQAKAQADAEARRMDAEIKVAEFEAKRQAILDEVELKREEMRRKLTEMDAAGMRAAEKHVQEIERGAMDLQKRQADIARVAVQAGAAAQQAEAA